MSDGNDIPAPSRLTQQVKEANQNGLVLRARVAEAMRVDQILIEPFAGGPPVPVYIGRIKADTAKAYSTLEKRLGELGYRVFLRDWRNPERGGEDGHYVALQQQQDEIGPVRWWLSALSILATLICSVFAGTFTMLGTVTVAGMLQAGLPFALTVVGFLVAHELGHFVAARWHGLPAAPPILIPLPLGLGTLGGFVMLRRNPRDRNALFDVGLSGPLAGLLVATLIFGIGLAWATVSEGAVPPNRSAYLQALVAVFRPDAAAAPISLTPVLYAARAGIMLTMINLLPIGGLDGSFISYAALGARWHRVVRVLTLAAIAGVAFAGVAGVGGVGPEARLWFFVLLFGGINGGRVPVPMDDVSPISLPRNGLFLAVVVLFLTMFSTRPF